MNEPLSALQRIAEEFEHVELLHKASKAKDSMERLCFVTAFAIAGLSSNKYRSSRKPFNPLLGETYECIRPDKGFKFISEKVSHHPPVLAFHAEANLWKVEGYFMPSQKFWGRSLEILVNGDTRVTLPGTKEVFTIKKPSSFLKNLMAGTKYIEVAGDLVVQNEDSGETATINFKGSSSWGYSSSRNKFEGKVCDENGTAVMELVGNWGESIDRKKGGNSFDRLWEIGEYPKNVEKYYGFSPFAVQLNEVTDLEKHVAPSDSRLRPDQRALEDGNFDLAEKEKKRVEEKQREKRRQDRIFGSQFFEKKGEGWKYNETYFEQREKRAFQDPDIF